MRSFLLELISLAMLTSAALLFADSERMKSAVKLVGCVAMTTLLLSNIVHLDYSAYSSELRKQSLLEIPDLRQTQADAERLDRLVIEEECAAYIWNKAEERNVEIVDVSVSLAWNSEGYWYPQKAVIRVPAGQHRDDLLSDLIWTELGIAPSDQQWEEDKPSDELD